MTVIPALGMWRQEDQKFRVINTESKPSLGYDVILSQKGRRVTGLRHLPLSPEFDPKEKTDSQDFLSNLHIYCGLSGCTFKYQSFWWLLFVAFLEEVPHSTE